MLFVFFFLLFAPARYFHSREDIFFPFRTQKRGKKLSSLSPLLLSCPSLSFESSRAFPSRTKKFKKTRKEPREREKTKIIALPHNNLFDISLFLLRATMETMNTTTNNKREGDEKDEDEEDKKRTKKDELEGTSWRRKKHILGVPTRRILEEEVYVQI